MSIDEYGLSGDDKERVFIIRVNMLESVEIRRVDGVKIVERVAL